MTINDLRFESKLASNQSIEGLISISGGVNITINRPSACLSGNGDIGAGLCGLMQFCRNVAIHDPRVGSNVNGRGQASLGRMFNFSNCINVKVYNAWYRRGQNSFCFVESFCEDVTFYDADIELSDNFLAAAPVYFVGQGSEVKIINPTVRNQGAVSCNLTDSGGTDSKVYFSGTVKWRGQLPTSLPMQEGIIVDYACDAAATFTGSISGTTLTVTNWAGTRITPGAVLKGVGVVDGTTIVGLGTANYGNGTYTVSVSQTVASTSMRTKEWAMVDYRAPQIVNQKIPVYANQYESFSLGGPFFEPTLYASSGLNTANISGLYLGYDTINGSSQLSLFTPGTAKSYSGMDNMGYNYGGLQRMTGFGYMLVVHSASAATPGSFVGITAKLAKVISTSFTNAANYTVRNISLADRDMSLLLTGHRTMDGGASFTPAAVAVNGQATVGTVTVTGCLPGDIVSGVAPPSSTGGLRVWGEVTAANTVTIYLSNGTTASITPPSGIYRVNVRKS